MSEGPPVLVGEGVFWLGSGSGIPKKGTVKWLGRLAEMGPGWAVGVELEEELPVGGIDGAWGGRRLFTCTPKHGLIVPASSLLGHRRFVIEAGQSKRRSRLKTSPQQRKKPHNTSQDDKLTVGLAREEDGAVARGRTLPGDRLLREEEEKVGEGVYGWMVDRERRTEQDAGGLLVKRRRELNRSLEEGLASLSSRRGEGSQRDSYHSSRSAGSSRTRTSAIFSIFRWFKKEDRKEGWSDSEERLSEPGSPVLVPRTRSITGSVDTLFSTATANSFAFLPPQQYRPFGLANQPDVRIEVGPETSTYRNRIRDRDRLRVLEKNVSLREKYRLYGSGTIPRSVDHLHELTQDLNELKKSLDSQRDSKNSTLGRKKRKAPQPPSAQSSLDESQLENRNPDENIKQHRRTVSEPLKFHVKGKRKAPPPPGTNIDSDVISISTSNSNSSRRSRKKKRAPSPPIKKTDSNEIVNIIREATNGILSDELGTSGNESQKEETASNASTLDIGLADVVCTDTLKLERGILKPNMDRPYAEPKICPSSPVSPRPWYKRAANKDAGSVRDKDKKKERDRRKVEDWMLESGIPRRSLINSDNRYNIFSRADKTDDKRKSQISILTNISELDREAAEIIKRGKEREKTLIDTHNAMYYNDNIVIAEGDSENRSEVVDNSRKTSARDLVSLFNAITHVTKVSANSSIFPQNSTTVFTVENKQKIPDLKYEKNFENANNKLPFEIESLDEIVHRKLTEKPEAIIVEEDKPGTSSASSVNSGSKIVRVTIEELDEYDAERNSKAQVLYEANKQNRLLVPPIPTITEVSESSAKSSPTSTIADKPGQTEPQDDVPTETKLAQVKQMNVWICPRCTLENLRWRITCEACDMWRPNPFELREKINSAAFNGAKNSKTHNKENNKFLYPNLTPIKGNSETPGKQTDTQVIEKTEGETKPIKDKKEVLEQKQQNTRDESSKNVEKELKIMENKIIYDKEPKGIKYNDNNILKSSTVQKQNEASSSKQTTTGIIKETNKPIPVKMSENNIEDSELSKTSHVLKKESNENNSSASSDGMNDEIRKARLAFFNKSATAKSIEEIPFVLEDDKKGNNLKENEENKPILSDKANENKIISSSKSIIRSEKDTRLNKYINSDKDVSLTQTNSNNQDLGIDQTSVNNKVQIQTTELQTKQSNDINDDIEKKKLKQMLIEMKHSLPKRPKPFKKLEKQNSVDEKVPECSSVSKTDVIILPSSSTESTTKEITTKPNPSPSTSISKPSTSPNNDYAEAYLIESETIIEEIKLKKPSGKVSSSVQTSGLVTQIAPKIIPSSGKELVIPIKIEENIIKDGILYTTTSNGVRKIGTGTFELMRPRDFANIKEIKTESKTGVSLPVYANIINDDVNSSVKSEQLTVNPSEYIDQLSKQLVKPQGVADFKARLDLRNDRNMNTLAVNRLLKRLEGAIVSGQLELAAGLARELAQMKVNCSVIRQKQELPTKEILLELYVEDKISHQGPFHIKVRPTITVRELKELIEREYEIPAGVQRWILANQLASDETSTLDALGINTDGFPIFLYLVAPDLNGTKTEETIEIEVKPSTSSFVPEQVPIAAQVPDQAAPPKDEPGAGPSGLATNEIPPAATSNLDTNPTGTMALGWKCKRCTLMNSPTRPGCAACGTGRPDEYKVPLDYKPNEAEALRIQKETKTDQASAKNVEEEKAQNYQKLVDLEKDDLIMHPEEFECPVCLVEYNKMEGIVLRECLHVFCRSCLANTIQFSDEAEVKCPFRDNNYTCDSTLLEREIKALVPPRAFEEHLAKSIALAETKIGNAFHCKTPDCIGWCIYEDNVNVFKCPVCTHTNCLTCQAVHEGLNCKQFQEELNNNSDMNMEVKRTKEMLQEMVERGEALNCPTCQVVLMKKWGCDWLRCSMCKTEICWITRGPRWGPNGKGDTSGGCQCGVNGIKCHPKCTYCH